MINFEENIESFEKVIITYLLYKNDDFELADDGGHKVDKNRLLCLLQPSFFILPLHVSIIEEMKSFYNNFHNIPSSEELKNVLTIKNIKYEKEEFKDSTEVNLSQYTVDFVYRYLVSFIKIKILNAQINKVAVNIKTNKVDPMSIDTTFDYVKRELGENIDVDITNDNEGLDLFNPISHIQQEKNTKGTGFEFFDKVLGGGYEPKTFIVLFGRPKVGKSLVISNMAARAVDKGLNVCLITVELSAGKYTKRLGSNLFSIPYSEYDNFKNEECLGLEKQYQEEYERKNPNHGVLITKEYPTGSINAFDIENYCKRIEKKRGIKFDVIFVDYLNLLNLSGVGGSDGGTYMPIKKTCEQLRKIAQRNLWCVVTATQAKQSAFTADDLGMDDVAESSGVIATVDTLVGIISPEGSINLKLKCVANRDNGYMGAYSDYEKMFKYYRLEEGNVRFFMSSDDKKNEEMSIKDSTESAAMLAVQKADENKTIDITTPSVTTIENPIVEQQTPLTVTESEIPKTTFQPTTPINDFQPQTKPVYTTKFVRPSESSTGQTEIVEAKQVAVPPTQPQQQQFQRPTQNVNYNYSQSYDMPFDPPSEEDVPF